MTEERKNIFRKKAIESISSPEQLTDYLRVTTPGIWVILAAVIFLLAGIFVWAAIGTLETKTDAKVFVEHHTAYIYCEGAETLTEGMKLRVNGQEYTIAATQEDDYGRVVGIAEAELPDGTYEAEVVTETVHLISFLLEGR